MKTLLIIDDDQDILEALSLLLEDEGYTINITSKGDEAVQKAIQHQPHLIMLDVLLSGKDGRHIAHELKSNEKTKHIPLLMVSAHPSVEQSVKEAGADEYLPKPFEIDHLLKTIKKMTSK